MFWHWNVCREYCVCVYVRTRNNWFTCRRRGTQRSFMWNGHMTDELKYYDKRYLVAMEKKATTKTAWWAWRNEMNWGLGDDVKLEKKTSTGKMRRYIFCVAMILNSFEWIGFEMPVTQPSYTSLHQSTFAFFILFCFVFNQYAPWHFRYWCLEWYILVKYQGVGQLNVVMFTVDSCLFLSIKIELQFFIRLSFNWIVWDSF